MARNLRNPENIAPLADLLTYVSFADDPKIGKDGSFGNDWYALGIMPEDSKIGLTRSVEKNQIKGQGFGVVAVTTKPGELTGSVEILEHNKAVDMIAWPDTYEDDGVKIRVHSGKVARVHVAHVFEDENGAFRIYATREKAYAKMENLEQGADPAGRTIDFDYMPDANRAVFDEYVIKPNGEETTVDFAQIRFVDAGEIVMNDAGTYKASVAGATGGTWTLTVGGVSAKGLKHDAKATDIQAALRKAGDKDVEVTGDQATGFTVAKANGDVAVDASKLTGGGFPKDVAVEHADA
ncbi:hypothetical protein C1Y63_10590 [Corynebacterium sp. 13CS0277]|uniref:hypothetical protein n=1 Tax=Corynebacterium sp. 13CS0277 TaxID=2071994 RepID=UPI000D0302F3|nr:hypothetical protein [Corynebacterium sp. 13CS0277]PRQ10633.1 hypothetical protein C1Y63_10590 [Corynebacterium sp. 13CS0277]